MLFMPGRLQQPTLLSFHSALILTCGLTCEGAADECDFCLAPKNHGNYVESNLVPGSVGFARVLARDRNQVRAFLLSHRPLWGAKLFAAARFYLDEHQRLAFPGDQVDLRIPRREPVIASDDCIALPPQMPVREILASPAAGQIGAPDSLPLNVPQPVDQNSQHLFLYGSQAPLDRFPAHDEAQIVFPKPAVAWKSVHQQLETQPSPKS